MFFPKATQHSSLGQRETLFPVFARSLMCSIKIIWQSSFYPSVFCFIVNKFCVAGWLQCRNCLARFFRKEGESEREAKGRRRILINQMIVNVNGCTQIHLCVKSRRLPTTARGGFAASRRKYEISASRRSSLRINRF
jgi:hypothetical protein